MRATHAMPNRRAASRSSARRGHAWAIAGVVVVTALAFSRVLENDF
jgi:hypothetical protein